MASQPALAQASGLRRTLGGAPLFEDAGFVLHKGDRAALVGANGAGKSTLMRIVAGLTATDAGSVAFASGATVAYVPQEPDFGDAATFGEFVRAGGAVRPHEADAALASFGLDPEAGEDRVLQVGEDRAVRALRRRDGLLLRVCGSAGRPWHLNGVQVWMW